MATDLNLYLESLLIKVSNDLARTYSSNQSTEFGLIFPHKRDGSLRISEQEAKLLFIQHLTVDRQFCFSVETPTRETYQQTGTTAISARVDLTLFGADRKAAAHIELKAHNCTVEAIRKDLEKLLRERTTGVWFHTLEKADHRTLAVLMSKFNAAFSLLAGCLHGNEQSYLIAFFFLENALLRWRWVHLQGDSAESYRAISEAFCGPGKESLWQTSRFPSAPAGHGQDSTTASIKTTASGRGAREAFLVHAPQLCPHSFMHLSVRGSSYRLRKYDLERPSTRPNAILAPGLPTVEALRASNQITQWISVSDEDMRHSIHDEPEYWCQRIRTMNLSRLL